MTQPESLPELPVLDECNYIAAFLTMACPYHCSYCINEFESSRPGFKHLDAIDWIRGLSRFANLQRDEGVVPVTFQGGEPSVHPDFYDIINGLPERIRIDILTNLSFDVEEMIARVDPARLRRKSPYASIRVSYHPDQVKLEELLEKTCKMQEAGFSIGIWGVLHPEQQEIILNAREKAGTLGIDFRTKEFLGFYNGKLFGHYKYPQGCSQKICQDVLCRTTELIIGPDGNVFRCHHDIYENVNSIGHILEPEFRMDRDFRPCDCFGHCNPCDLKIKTNRLQQFGYTAVDIRFEGTAAPTREIQEHARPEQPAPKTGPVKIQG